MLGPVLSQSVTKKLARAFCVALFRVENAVREFPERVLLVAFISFRMSFYALKDHPAAVVPVVWTVTGEE